MSFIPAILLIGLIAVYVLWPLFKRTPERRQSLDKTQTLLDKKEYLQSELVNLQHDYALERMDKTTYELTLSRLQKELNQIIEQIENDLQMEYSDLKNRLYSQISTGEQQNKGLNCPGCGYFIRKSDKFCSQCGYKLKS